MFLLTSRIIKHYLINRPAFLAGLFFFALLIKNGTSQSFPSFQSVTDLLYCKPVSLVELPDSSRLDLKYQFDPLLSEKPRSSVDTINSSIRSNTADIRLFVSRPSLKVFLSGTFSDLDIQACDDYQDYQLALVRRAFNVASGIMYAHHRFSAGIGIGRHFSKDADIEHWSEITANTKDYIAKGPWQYSVAGTVNLPVTKFHLSLFSGPVHSSIFTLSTNNNRSFRSFPITLIERSVQIGTSIKTRSFLSSTTAGITVFHNADLITCDNLMPQDIELTSYSLFTTGNAHLLILDSLFWKINAQITGGWVASYNFDRNNYTFFKADSLRLKGITGSIGLKAPMRIITGLSGTISQIQCPVGYLKLSALSVWSIFKPMDYRFKDIDLSYCEAGMFILRKFSLWCFDFTPSINFSHINVQFTGNYSHKEIVVLFPIYMQKESIDISDTKLFLLTPSLTTTLHVHSLSLTLSALQRIPFIIKEKQTGNGSSGGNDNAEFTGGTTISATMSWDIAPLPLP